MGGIGRTNAGGAVGAALNFKVDSYVSEEELNADTPKENAIGVITTTKMTGWYFAPEQPENMSDGEVWFLSGVYSTTKFNALKNNSIMVYPSGAKQMVSGALKDVVAKTYQDGKWIDWIVYLFNDGKLNENLTGGFQKFLNNCQGDAVVNSDGIYLTCKKSDSSWSGDTSFAAKKKTNISQFTKLCAQGSFAGGPGGLDIGVSSAANPTSSSTDVATARTNSAGSFDLSVDLTSVEGEHYIFLQLWFYAENATAANLSATVTKVWLE